MGRKALPLPGKARLDLDILIDLANRLGCGWTYKHVSDVYAEIELLPEAPNGFFVPAVRSIRRCSGGQWMLFGPWPKLSE